ncbi:MAG: hypothetical protein IPK18_01430 [Sphingobacteriales bacterium]|jgi:hypothetical protein|nr:MAG: hypothetical protein IPK18_01430 [Sphingobacteriales bacterium]
MTAKVEKAKIEKALKAVSKTVISRAKKFNQPVVIVENGVVKEVYPYKKEN